MSRVRAKPEARAEKAGAQRPGLSLCVLAPFLVKLAKHMALIACFMIVGNATGRATVGQLGLFFLIATAAVVYSIGRGLEPQPPTPPRLPLPKP